MAAPPDYYNRQKSPIVGWDDAVLSRKRVLILGAG
jgi:hypothetical protein